MKYNVFLTPFVLVSFCLFSTPGHAEKCLITIPVDTLGPEKKTVQIYKEINTQDGDFSHDGDVEDDIFSNDGRIVVSLAEGEHDSDNLFIQKKVGKISGRVLEDSNNDNVGDKPIAGIEIRLFNKFGEPAIDAFGVAVEPVVTDIFGYYEFDNLAADDYVVVKHRKIGSNPFKSQSSKKEKYTSPKKEKVVQSNPKADNNKQEVFKSKPNTETQNSLKGKTKSTSVVTNPKVLVENKESGIISNVSETENAEKKNDAQLLEMANKQILLVESSVEKSELSFLPFRAKYGNYEFKNFTYASHPKLGTGYEVELNLPSLFDFEMVFIKMDMGSFSDNMIKEIAEYILTGGKVYIIFDAFERSFYLDKMEENVNRLLRYLFIEDNLIFSHEIVNNQYKSGVVKTVQNSVRTKKNNRNKPSDNSDKPSLIDEIDKPILTAMGRGFYIKSVSDMSEAHSICQFENDHGTFITNVFWKVRLGGLGIGTEKVTSAYHNAGSLESWKIIEAGFNLNDQ